MARILDGVAIAATIRAEVRDDVAALAREGVVPGLAVVLVGDDPASQVYVRSKGKACLEAGMHSETVTLAAEASETEILATIDRLNADPRIDGILCQLPVPPHVNAERVIRRIDPAKDVDGFHPVNVGKTALGDPTGFQPATPFGVQQLLIRAGVPTEGAHAVIVGRSNIVGRPLANLLSLDTAGGNATTTLAHSRTRDLAALCRTADILIVAIGRAGFLGADAVKPGATVIDVGINRVDDATRPRGYRLAGDVDFESVSAVAGAITPVPGGVGPMTIAMLLVNTVRAARARVQPDA
ncbi:MAG: bifunctional 5,10-methylenetetrahydrofolate dehydrogenase/5,10-methenyltetrahydrofolate cyclohydrolase [Gemmatimonadales bacterium]|nr:bifunctional 5,10-methylenetetrahydrofolate dehydrogenase/5,10-methenyltetrahydrofolate cyclohydrolase [Gemmatimonadales bacterium]